MNDLVSIITPVFNSEKYISETINSVINQTYTNWEMILVDDASTDISVEIIKTYQLKDKRIKLYQLEKNSGAGVARNFAIEKAQGRYIAFLDADDLWKSNKLRTQISFLEQHKLPMTFSFYETIDENGNSLNTEIQTPSDLKYWQLHFCNFIGNLTTIYDTKQLGKIPISSIRKRQDWILWLTILKKIKHAKPVQQSLAFYRKRDNSISASKTTLLQYNYKVYKEYYRYSTVTALFCMMLFLFFQLIVKPFYIKKL